MKLALDDSIVTYDPTPHASEHARLQEARRIYAAVPGSTVAGLARRYGVDRERMRRALVGRYGGANLVQLRIDAAVDLRADLGVRVHAEPAELEPRRKKRRRERAPPKKEAARPRYEPIVGASRREAMRRHWASVRATSAAPAPARAAPRPGPSAP